MPRYEVIEHCGAWVVMADADGLYGDERVALDECNNRNFSRYDPQRRWKGPKFKVGDRVRIQRIMVSDSLTSFGLLGVTGTVEEIDYLPNGEYNYDVGGKYLNEYMLELAPVPEEASVVSKLREVNLEEK